MNKTWPSMALVLTLTLIQLVVNVSLAASTSSAPWWNDAWHYRTQPYNLYLGDYDRRDVAFEMEIDFSSLLSEWAASGTFDENSTRVIEYSATGQILWETPYQFEKGAEYNATSFAYGIIAWVVNGTTASRTTRIYYIYFDILENAPPKNPPSYTGVSGRVSGDYVIIENEKVNVTIRYKNGVYLESLYFDRDTNGAFESNEEMMRTTLPYTFLVKVTDAEMNEHNWTAPFDNFFMYSNDENATATVLRNGPVLAEIQLSDVSLKNQYREALNVSVTLLFRVYKLSTRIDMRTRITTYEELDAEIAYERIFLDHQALYNRWYVDENYNGRLTYSRSTPPPWLFSAGILSSGFISSYNSSGNGGLALIPSMQYYSRIWFGEYNYLALGPASRLEISSGLWPSARTIELENRLFVHVGNWAAVSDEMRNISSPPILVATLSVHLVDFNNLDLDGAELRVYDSDGNVARTAFTGETGWAVLGIEAGTYSIRPFWLGTPVAEYTLSFSTDMTIDPLKCSVYSLSVSTTTISGNIANDVTVGIYSQNGTRLVKSLTNSTGSAFFQQLPAGNLVIKTFYLAEQFGTAESITLSNNTQLTVSERGNITGPKQRHDVLYVAMLVFFAAAGALAILRVKNEKFILGLFVSIMLLATFLAIAFIQSNPIFAYSSDLGISASYSQNEGYLTVGDTVKMKWKDLDRNGEIDDHDLFVTVSNGTELFKIDLGTTLATPASVYKLSEADTRTVAFLDIEENEYVTYVPLTQEPDFSDIEYPRILNLKFVFSKANSWGVSLNSILEMGKPYIQMQWEIAERGEGEGDFSIYPQIIPLQPLDRLILPANYTGNELRFWNQKDGPTHASPWSSETDWSLFGAFVANMHVNNPNVYLHSGDNYAIQTNIHASSAFARYSKWVHNRTGSYFQYDFWVDWDGTAAPTSDIEIEVWVPDALDLNSSRISYTNDGSTWTEYKGWSLAEGNRGESGFSQYAGCRHRLKIVFPSSHFTANDDSEAGRDYGIPYVKNDEYLVRFRVAYQNEGLTTYEFESSSDKWYGLQNINDSWMWLLDTNQGLSAGIVLSKPLETLSVQASNVETYRSVTMGFTLPLVSNGRAVFYTNIVIFANAQAGMQDQDSDGVWNMFEENMPQFFSLSVPQTSKETFARLSYNEGVVYGTNVFRITLTKEPIENDWNTPARYTVYLSNGILQHLESDDAVYQFERNDFYVYDVWQTNEVMWKESIIDPQARYPLYASIGLIAIGCVLLLRYRTIVRKYRVILILLLAALTIRLFFGSFSTDFGGSDAAVYGNAAQNIINNGQLQVNYIAPEPHWIRAGLIPEEITHPFNNPARLLYSLLLAFSFALFNPSFFAIKYVDILLGALLVIPTFYLTKKLFNEKTAIVAAAIVVFHPLLINYSGVLPSTGIMTAFLATSALCAMVYEGNKTAIIAGFFIGLSLFARMEFGFILLATVVSYYILTFKRSFFRKKSLYVTVLVFLVALALLLYFSYAVLGKFAYSTKILGGTFGETREPGLLETLSNPDFMQIRVYNASYGWWHVFFMAGPLVFIMAVAGLLLNIKSWRTMSGLYLFPFYGVLAFSMAVREQPHARFIVEYMPAVAVLSASFIIALSQFLLPRLTDRPKPERNIKFKQILTVFVFIEIIFMSFFPHYLAINTSMQNLAWKFNDGELYKWIKTNTSPKSVIMANSAVFVFHTDREIVIIPRPRGPSQPVDISMIVNLIRHYKIDYLVIDYTTRSIPDLADLRSDPVNAPYGFNLVYWNENPLNFDPRVLVYDVRALNV